MSATESELRAAVSTYGSAVFAAAMRIVADRPTAEEIAQDVFLHLWRTRPTFATADHMRHWLRKVAIHRATDALRRRMTQPQLVTEGWLEMVQAEIPQMEPGQYETAQPCRAGSAELSTRLDGMVRSLPDAMRAAMVLRYGEDDMTPDEIAKLLGQPVATVKSNLQRGLAMLRRKAGVALKEYVRHA